MLKSNFVNKLKFYFLLLTVSISTSVTTAQNYTFDDFVGTWHGYISSENYGGFNDAMTMTIEEDGYYTENTGRLMPTLYPNTQQCEYDGASNRMHWWYLETVYAGQYFYQNFYYEVVYFQNDTLEMHYNFWDDPEPYPEDGTIFLVKEHLTPPPFELMAEFDGYNVMLQWEEPSSSQNDINLEGYHIYVAYENQDFELLTFVEENQYEHMPDLLGGSYYYYLTALYNSGESGPTEIIEMNTTATGISMIDQTSISAFPNPTSDFIKISSNDLIEFVEIYNYNGQLIERIDMNTYQSQIDFNEVEIGIYLLKIKTAKGSFTEKVSVY